MRKMMTTNTFSLSRSRLAGIQSKHQSHSTRETLTTRLTALVAAWCERHASRVALRRFDDRLLRDIGMERDRAEDEIAKPFWRS